MITNFRDLDSTIMTLWKDCPRLERPRPGWFLESSLIGAVSRADSDAKLLRYLRPGAAGFTQAGHPGNRPGLTPVAEPLTLGPGSLEPGF